MGRLQDRRAAATGQLAVLKESREQTIIDTAENITDPKTTLAWSQLVSRRAALEGELTRLSQEYKPIHPDVIAKTEGSRSGQRTDGWHGRRLEREDQRKAGEARKEPKSGISKAEAEIKLADGEIKRQQKMLAENEKAIAEL